MLVLPSSCCLSQMKVIFWGLQEFCLSCGLQLWKPCLCSMGCPAHQAGLQAEKVVMRLGSVAQPADMW